MTEQKRRLTGNDYYRLGSWLANVPQSDIDGLTTPQVAAMASEAIAADVSVSSIETINREVQRYWRHGSMSSAEAIGIFKKIDELESRIEKVERRAEKVERRAEKALRRHALRDMVGMCAEQNGYGSAAT